MRFFDAIRDAISGIKDRLFGEREEAEQIKTDAEVIPAGENDAIDSAVDNVVFASETDDFPFADESDDDLGGFTDLNDNPELESAVEELESAAAEYEAAVDDSGLSEDDEELDEDDLAPFGDELTDSEDRLIDAPYDESWEYRDSFDSYEEALDYGWDISASWGVIENDDGTFEVWVDDDSEAVGVA